MTDQTPSGRLRCFISLPHPAEWYRARIADFEQLLALVEPANNATSLEFFQPGVTYIENRPFAAPETLTVFRCELVTDHPRTGAGLRALGFQCHANPATDWVSTAMTISDWTAGWNIYTPLGTWPTQPPAPAPHRVTARTLRVLGPAATDDWEDETTYDIEHTPQCDALPYGTSCWLDQQQADVGTDDWPTEPGRYIATGRPEKSFNGEVTEYDFYLDFEPAATPAPEPPR
jgi:hypothetical protein